MMLARHRRFNRRHLVINCQVTRNTVGHVTAIAGREKAIVHIGLAR